MPEVRDTVKLFGWTITSESSSPSLRSHMMDDQSVSDNSKEDNTSLQILFDLNKESKETSQDSDDQHSEITTVTSEEEKPTDLKKPDKILPCPRCNSADTKFCYYNNYNVNQPRHFCRNCQRYWTAGGSMRTVPVGAGRRKNKGWVSSEHYMHITSDNASNDYTDNYNSSSTKILSFESSDSLVSDNGKHELSDTKTNTDSVSQELNNFQGFLPPQVTSPVLPPWPYHYPSFYHMPVYWGVTVPFWSTLETSTFLGKRTRNEASHETVGESKNALVSTKNETSIATKNHVWYPVPMKREKTEQFSFLNNGSERKSSNKKFVPETYLNLQANPAAMARSMNFRESM